MTIFLIKSNRSYEISERFIRENPQVRSQLGEVISIGLVPMGGVSISNGRGEANFDIKVKGTMKSATINISLYKESNSDWKIKEYKMK
ncbi:hypothetical protein GK047_24160 [Paenibacillus sp. SYP-B3998]|uniref:DUF4878 domain-containing protein n=2 Tax=Paenibacillus sp. SYP-B3998 TaxID=2678564 RepID=A0A6G4A552_9BACL|nr:hypothetical protein [Paenibacillus sp. SYP-B3998]